jgi:hypothetical protein
MGSTLADLLAFADVAIGLGTPFLAQLLWGQRELLDHP